MEVLNYKLLKKEFSRKNSDEQFDRKRRSNNFRKGKSKIEEELIKQRDEDEDKELEYLTRFSRKKRKQQYWVYLMRDHISKS